MAYDPKAASTLLGQGSGTDKDKDGAEKERKTMKRCSSPSHFMMEEGEEEKYIPPFMDSLVDRAACKCVATLW